MKKKISITIENDLKKWIDTQVKNKVFANRSHGMAYAVQQLKNNT